MHLGSCIINDILHLEPPWCVNRIKTGSIPYFETIIPEINFVEIGCKCYDYEVGRVIRRNENAKIELVMQIKVFPIRARHKVKKNPENALFYLKLPGKVTYYVFLYWNKT